MYAMAGFMARSFTGLRTLTCCTSLVKGCATCYGMLLSAEIKAATRGYLARLQWLSGGLMRVLFIVMVVVGPDRLRVDGRLKAARQDVRDVGRRCREVHGRPPGGCRGYLPPNRAVQGAGGPALHRPTSEPAFTT